MCTKIDAYDNCLHIQFRKDEAQSEDDVPYKYEFFHFIFAIGAMHFAMLFINWDMGHSTRK